MSRKGDRPEFRRDAKNRQHNELDKRYQTIYVQIRILGVSMKAAGKMPVDAPSALAIALLIVMTAAAIPAVALAVIDRFTSGGPIETIALSAASLLSASLFGLVKVIRRK